MEKKRVFKDIFELLNDITDNYSDCFITGDNREIAIEIKQEKRSENGSVRYYICIVKSKKGDEKNENCRSKR